MFSKVIKVSFFILVGVILAIGIKAPLLFRVPSLISITRAKMFCSCYFIVGQTRPYCENFVKKNYPMTSYKIDEETKSITFSLLSDYTVMYKDKYKGCQLIDKI